jgi:hypothetical protein
MFLMSVERSATSFSTVNCSLSDVERTTMAGDGAGCGAVLWSTKAGELEVCGAVRASEVEWREAWRAG